MNNNNRESVEARCQYCGRYITLGELKDGVRTFNYVCPACFHARHTRVDLTDENFSEKVRKVFE